MGFFYKHIIHPFLSRGIGRKAISNNPYLCLVIDASEEDVIADELFRISLAYQHGYDMLPQDNNKAMEYCLKAANRGHAVAQLFAAQWLMRFHDDNNKEVMDWLIKAAEQGEKQAMYNLGISYHRGDIDGSVDIRKSYELFRPAAERDYPPAFTRMAQIYHNGEYVDKSDTIAKYWAWLEFTNMQEDERANSILNVLLEKNDITDDNHIKGRKIIEEAALAGERDAMNNWATGLYNTGEKEKAIDLWERSIEQGHPIAMCNLARELRTEGNKDYQRALELFERSASLKYEGAYYGLAVTYYQGLGVERDIKKAWYYLEKSLNFGSDDSRFLLATMGFSNELNEILPDKVMRAASYMEQAAIHGYKPAIEFYQNQKQK